MKKRSSGLFGGGEGDPDWTAAVEQLAWEKDLNLSTSGASAMKMDDGPAPLDQVDTPPDSRQQVSGPPTESTMVSYLLLKFQSVNMFSFQRHIGSYLSTL